MSWWVCAYHWRYDSACDYYELWLERYGAMHRVGWLDAMSLANAGQQAKDDLLALCVIAAGLGDRGINFVEVK